ncbi:alpha/beta fold hydrolase [Micromonospora sp. WMMD558]|uniref:alpha/beta fold hydrolase n=1 Tax=Micromonospora sp. WMMD558 TaxID=3403462 RepID=UPI003BF50229
MPETDVVVIGAGQAGLSSAYHLRASGLDFVVLDANPAPGGAWQHRWPTLRMETVHGIFDLPGLHFTPPAPEEQAADAVPAYFASFEQEFGLDVRRPVAVTAVRNGDDGRLLVESDQGTWATRALINATGTWTRPFVPRYPGQETFRGRQLHTVDYRAPEEFAGKRVVVVGGGASAAQLLVEIADVATATTWVTRRPPVFRDSAEYTEEYRLGVIAKVEARVRAGLPPGSVASVIDLPWTPQMARARDRGVLVRRPMFDRITPDGVEWRDGARVDADVIFWCTGWRPALDHLAPLRLRGRGGGIVMDGTRVVADPRIHLVGYGPSASTVGANRAGRAAVRELRALLARHPPRRPADPVTGGAQPPCGRGPRPAFHPRRVGNQPRRVQAGRCAYAPPPRRKGADVVSDQQPTVVLVHGAFADSASWNGVIERLGAGYSAVAAANPLRGLAGDAAYVRDVMRGIGGPVVLVGHSYGGMVVTAAATDDPSVRALVYVNAFCPDSGESALTLSQKFPGSTLADTLVSYPVSTGGNEVAIGQDAYHQQFAADVPGDLAAVMARTQRPVTEQALGEDLSAASPAWRSLPSWFIFGDADRNIPVAAHRFMADRAGPRGSREISGASHAIGVSQPAEVAETIIEAVRGTGG